MRIRKQLEIGCLGAMVLFGAPSSAQENSSIFPNDPRVGELIRESRQQSELLLERLEAVGRHIQRVPSGGGVDLVELGSSPSPSEPMVPPTEFDLQGLTEAAIHRTAQRWAANLLVEGLLSGKHFDVQLGATPRVGDTTWMRSVPSVGGEIEYSYMSGSDLGRERERLREAARNIDENRRYIEALIRSRSISANYGSLSVDSAVTYGFPETYGASTVYGAPVTARASNPR